MSTGKIIITAHGANAKLINRLLLHLRDWEFGSGDRFSILRTRDDASAGELPVDTPPVQSFSSDRVPIQDPFENQWEGLSTEEVEKYMLIKDDGKGSTSLFLLLDDQGAQDFTIAVFHRAMSYDDKDTLYLPEYNKTRVPLMEAYGIWCNLDIANVGFDELCDREIGQGENRWWSFKPIFGEDHYVEFARQRDAAIKELEKLDMA